MELAFLRRADWRRWASRARQPLAAFAFCLLLCSHVCSPGAGAQEPAKKPAQDAAQLKISIGELDAVPGAHGGDESGGANRPAASDKAEPPLPAEGVSRHSLALPDRTLSFTAKVGAIAFEDQQGAAVADMGYFAYLLDGREPRTRPVTFVINGGPGSASAWLNVGALGPWRLPLTQAAVRPTAPADLLPNADTWLDFTDLVFIDPVGTGYSRLHSKDKAIRDKFWSVQGDINALAVFIKRWLEANGRLGSPKLLVGESYGGFRAPRVAQALQSMPGIALNGIVMLSPALAIPRVSFPGLGNGLTRAASFPSLAAAIADAKGPVSTGQLAAFERESITGYLPDFLAGPRDAAAVERLAARMAAITGLDIETVRQIGPRASPSTFLAAIDRHSGRASSLYDATEKRAGAYDGPELVEGGDDLSGLSFQLARGIGALVQGPLGWRPQREYQVRGAGVRWSWTGSESVTALRSALVRDPTLRVLIGHGYADLITPYFRTKLQLDQMPTIGADNGRVRLEVYGGGHMFYSRDVSRARFRKDALALFEAVATGR